jgi:hypothetical protein
MEEVRWFAQPERGQSAPSDDAWDGPLSFTEAMECLLDLPDDAAVEEPFTFPDLPAPARAWLGLSADPGCNEEQAKWALSSRSALRTRIAEGMRLK